MGCVSLAPAAAACVAPGMSTPPTMPPSTCSAESRFFTDPCRTGTTRVLWGCGAAEEEEEGAAEPEGSVGTALRGARAAWAWGWGWGTQGAAQGADGSKGGHERGDLGQSPICIMQLPGPPLQGRSQQQQLQQQKPAHAHVRIEENCDGRKGC